MAPDVQIFDVLARRNVPFVIVGGHAVNFHGYGRATEDTDIVWVRSPEAEQALLAALTEMDAQYIGTEIDPATGLERTYPVTLAFVQSSRLMMLWTKYGFLDLFDYVPGSPAQDVAELLATSVVANGRRYASLAALRRMKRAAARPKDLLDLENLPE
jgi:hypothetical protein